MKMNSIFTPDESSLISQALMAYGIIESDIYDKLETLEEFSDPDILSKMSISDLLSLRHIIKERIQNYTEWGDAYKNIDIELHLKRSKEADNIIRFENEKLNRINKRIEKIISSI